MLTRNLGYPRIGGQGERKEVREKINVEDTF